MAGRTALDREGGMENERWSEIERRGRRTEVEERSQAGLLSLMKSLKCWMVYECRVQCQLWREKLEIIGEIVCHWCPAEILRVSEVRGTVSKYLSKYFFHYCWMNSYVKQTNVLSFESIKENITLTLVSYRGEKLVLKCDTKMDERDIGLI